MTAGFRVGKCPAIDSSFAAVWSNWAIWNHTFEIEKPVECASGEVQPWEIERPVIVHRASRSCYDKYGEYNLKMVFINNKSAKGRY